MLCRSLCGRGDRLRHRAGQRQRDRRAIRGPKDRPGSVEDKLIQAPLAMKAALGENPKRVYTEQKSSPQTRMATAALLRRALLEAQAYAKKRAEKEGADLTWQKRPCCLCCGGNCP